VLEEPVVVVDLGEVAAPGVRDDRDEGRAGPKRSATWSIAQTAVPPEPPTRIPSSRASRRAMRKESRSETVMNSSTRDGSKVVGQKSSPMPSTR
jgi:hypothetical protein